MVKTIQRDYALLNPPVPVREVWILSFWVSGELGSEKPRCHGLEKKLMVPSKGILTDKGVLGCKGPRGTTFYRTQFPNINAKTLLIRLALTPKNVFRVIDGNSC